MDDLSCPKCGNPWRSFERNGITVDQCTGCRGVFLDRGELERLIEAEGQFHEGRGLARAEELGYAERYREHYPSPHHRGDDDDDDDDERGERGHDREHGGYGRKRHRERGGFLEDLLGGG